MGQGFQIKWHDQMLELMEEDFANDDEDDDENPFEGLKQLRLCPATLYHCFRIFRT